MCRALRLRASPTPDRRQRPVLPNRIVEHRDDTRRVIELPLVHEFFNAAKHPSSRVLRRRRASPSLGEHIQPLRNVQHEHGVSRRVVDGILLHDLEGVRVKPRANRLAIGIPLNLETFANLVCALRLVRISHRERDGGDGGEFVRDIQRPLRNPCISRSEVAGDVGVHFIEFANILVDNVAVDLLGVLVGRHPALLPEVGELRFALCFRLGEFPVEFLHPAVVFREEIAAPALDFLTHVILAVKQNRALRGLLPGFDFNLPEPNGVPADGL